MLFRNKTLLIFLFLLTPFVSWSQITLNTPSDAYRYQVVEFELKKRKTNKNPFTEAKLIAQFTDQEGKIIQINGFCDAQDGTNYKLRFTPSQTGIYTYTITYAEEKIKKEFRGKIKVKPSKQRGFLRVDPQYPSHFIWEGTGEHYFWNGTTAYWLMGWKDEKIIKEVIDRLATLKINRIRVAINGRQDDGKRWYEPMVKESSDFTFKLNPWIARYPDDLDNPDFDVTRFNIPYWQKLDRLVQYAGEKDIVISLIFYVDGLEHGCDPFKKEKMAGEDEKRYYDYAIARYAAYTNIMWDIANEYHLFRNEEWVKEMGPHLYQNDPYKHLISVHGNEEFPFRTSAWVNMALYQSWDECGGFDFMLSCREKQQATGRMIPQINEEYGYEGHYPPWGCGPEATKEQGGRSADNRRKLAWEIYMAGAYQTTGERADDGTGAGKNTGGGWINGRGNDTMTMLQGYAHIRSIFEQTQYWKLEPMPELVNNGNLCLAEPGKQYLVYSRIQHCRLKLPLNQNYSVLKINPRTGEKTDLGVINSNKAMGAWQYPKELKDDWAFILKRVDEYTQK